MSGHTPTPWVVGDRHTNNGVFTLDGDVVANTHSSQRNFDVEALRREQDANAAFIVKAVNAHEALVEALEECLREHGGYTIKGGIEHRARTAIALAKGGE